MAQPRPTLFALLTALLLSGYVGINQSMALDRLPPDHRLAADQTLTGRVTDATTGGGLPGVSVVIKGTSRGTTTDTEGKYSVVVPDQNATLIFSFIGYVTQEIVVGNRSTLNITLSGDDKTLSEIVVVG